MNQNTRKSIVQQIVRLATSAITDQVQINQIMQGYASLSESPFRLLRIIHSESIVFMLIDDTVNEYTKLLERLLQQEEWQAKFSAEYLDKAMQKILAILIKEGKIESTGHLFDQLINELNTYFRKLIIYIPLAGISLYADSFLMGNVVFRKMTDDYVDGLCESFNAVTMLTLSSPEVKESHNSWTKQHLNNLRGTVCAEFNVNAESQRARERAEWEARQVLDLLRYSASVLYSKGLNVAVGLQGEVISVIRIIPVLSLDGQSTELITSREGFLSPFELSPENIQKMEQIGILKVAKLLENPKKQTSFEKTLLHGIHWFATSQTQFEKENEFLNLMTCLETFLTPSGITLISPSLANQVAEGVARLLTTELQNRVALKQRIKDLYGMRSGLSHGGQKAILEADLADLRSIVKELIFQMIARKDEFSTHEALLKWLDERRLAG